MRSYSVAHIADDPGVGMSVHWEPGFRGDLVVVENEQVADRAVCGVAMSVNGERAPGLEPAQIVPPISDKGSYCSIVMFQIGRPERPPDIGGPGRPRCPAARSPQRARSQTIMVARSRPAVRGERPA